MAHKSCKTLGYRLSLEALFRATLGTTKGADGLQALEWYRQGEMEKISKYCKEDAVFTRNLLHFGVEHGYFMFEDRIVRRLRIVVDLPGAVRLCEKRQRGIHQSGSAPYAMNQGQSKGL